MEDLFWNFYGVVHAWILGHLLKVILIVVIASAAQHFSGKVIVRLIDRFVRKDSKTKRAEEKRKNTLVQVLHGAAYITIWLTATMMVLSELGVAIGPLMAALGVAGLAFGFGGQYLIRDLISGTFIILENQYRTGDVVCFDKTCGLVEYITLRTTTLRDLNGTVHHVPHGEVKIVSNLSKDYSRVNLNVGIAYDSDIEQVIQVVNRVGKEMAEDPKWQEHILKAPEFLRVDDFAESAIIIKIVGDTMPIMQWDVTGELRKRLKINFDKEGIKIPLPQRVMHQVG